MKVPPQYSLLKPTLRAALALSAAIAIVGCASSDTVSDATAEASAVAPRNVSANGEPLICRNEQVTGTNFRERVCLTAEGWKALQAAERRGAREFGRQMNERSGQQAAGQSNAPAGSGI
ncbi:MAG: hypothetical protein SV422_11460 [Pseudomonadota bacterium]|nr:hypothetical protein [Pseudomonadota bacterium]